MGFLSNSTLVLAGVGLPVELVTVFVWGVGVPGLGAGEGVTLLLEYARGGVLRPRDQLMELT